MKRYEGALRRLSILFLFISLFSPLNQLASFDDNRALAEDAPDPLGTGSLSITLLDDSGNRVGGAGFTVYDSQGRSLVGGDPDGDGVTVVMDIAVGDVTVTQSRFVEGYSPSLEPTYTYVGASPENYHTVYTSAIVQTQALQVEAAAPPDADGDGIPDATDSCPYDWNLGTDWNLNGVDDACDPNPDRDADGLTNDVEANLGTNPDVWDTDGDGLGDGDEVNVYGTNPLVADTDGDGVGDGAEINAGTDPLVAPPADTDGDGIPDADDSCPEIANTGVDTDSDGIDDACDPLNDADGDGIDDAVATQQAIDAAIATQQAADAQATQTAADAQATQAAADALATQQAADAQATRTAADALATEQAVPTATSTPEPAPEMVVTQRVLDAKGAEITSAKVGDTITFEVTVSNAGNVDLNNISVSNSLKGIGKLACDPADLATLAVGGKITCTATYKVSEQDQKAGNIENVATVASDEAKADPVTSSVTVGESMMRTTSLVGPMAAGDGPTASDITADWGVSYVGTRTPDALHNELTSDKKLTCGDTVHFFVVLRVSGSADSGTSTVTINPQFITGWGGSNPIGFTSATASLAPESTGGTVETVVAGSANQGYNTGYMSVPTTISGVEAGEVIYVEYQVQFTCGDGVVQPNGAASGTRSGGTFSVVNAANATSSGNIAGNNIPLQGKEVFVPPAPSMAISKTCDEQDLSSLSIGDEVTFTVTIENTGNRTLSSVSVTDLRAGSFNEPFPATLDVGSGPVSRTFTTTITSEDADLGLVTNTVRVSSDLTASQDVSDSCAITIANAKISIAKTCAEADSTAVRKLGDSVTFNVTVTNEGNVPLTSVEVIDTRTGEGEGFLDGGFSSDFAVGQSETKTFTAIINANDMTAGKVINEVSVTSKFGAADVTSGPVTAECIFVPANASITISKQCAESETGVLQIGETVTFSVTVHNDGNVALTEVMVQDTRAGPGEGFDSEFPDEFAAGHQETRTFTAVINANDVTAGTVDNSVSVTAEFGTEDVSAESELVSCDFTPYAAISVSKTCPDTANVRVGNAISYPVTIENTGDVEITGITVVESRVGTFDPELPTTLAVGDSYTGTFTYTVTDADVTAGHLNNTITVTTDQGATQDTANDEATAECAFTPVMSYTFTKACPELDGPIYVGDPLSYEITLINTGDVPLTGIELSDIREGGTFGAYDTTLARGEQFTVTFTSALTETDVTNGNVNNTVYLDAMAGSTVVEDEASTPDCAFTLADPQISIAKVCPEFEAEVQPRTGDTITYAVTITNEGNVPLTGLEITETRGTLAPNDGFDPIDDAFVLGVGATWQGTVTDTITATDAANGNLANTITVTTAEGAQNESDIICPFDALASLSISKVCQEVPAGAVVGDPISYTITVENTGDVDLTNVVITDSRDAEWIHTIDTLAAGSDPVEIPFTTTITHDDAAAGTVANIAYVVSDQTEQQQASDSCAFAPVSGMTIAKACVEPQDLTDLRVGQTVQFSVTITNTGDTTLENITVVDERDGDFDSAFPATLAPGSAPVTRVFTTTVTSADALAGTVANGVSVTADATIGGQLVEDVAGGEASANCDFTPYVDISVSKTCADLAAQPRVGNALSYPITVVNNSDVPVTISMATDSRVANDGGSLTPSPVGETIQPGGELSFAYVGTLTALDAVNGNVDNTVSVTAGYTLDGTTISATASDAVECPFAALMSITIDKSCPDLAGVREGDSVSYPVTITNNGDVDLTELVVTDTRAGTLAPAEGYAAIDDAFVLEPGDTWEGTFTYTVTYADTNAGNLDNRISVSTAEGAEANSDILCPIDAVEEISIAKVCQEIPAGAVVGDPISYTVTIENTGDIDLTGIEVTDDRAGSFNEPFPETLAAGSGPVSRTFTTTITNDDAAAGTIANSVTVEAMAGTVELVKSASASCAFMPVTDISISKTCPEIDAGASIGDDVVYSVTITNEGDVALSGISIDEPRAGTWSETPPTTLAPRATWTGTFTTQLTGADAALGSVNNTISVTADAIYGPEADPVTIEVDAESVANCAFMPVTGFSVSKTCPEQDLTGARIGSPLTYEITVLNTGDVALTNVVVTDARDATWSETIASIPVGESASVTFTSAITAGDAAAGNVDNTATVVADVVVGGVTTTLDSVSTTIECPFTPTTGVSIGKTCPEPTAGTRVDSPVTYEVTITNTGDVELTGIEVDEARAGSWSAAFPATLAAGDSATRIFTSPITLADAAAGSIDNTASVTADATVGETTSEESDTVTLECPFTPVTGIAISKTCPEPATLEDAAVGDEITYEVTITNTGDVELTGITVIESRDGSLVPNEGYAVLADAVLAPQGEAGDTWIGTFTSTITLEDAANGTLNNTISASATATYGPDSEPVSGPVESGDFLAECAFNPFEGISISKTCPEIDPDARVGDEITYQVTITNTGDVTLTNIVVDDERTGTLASNAGFDPIDASFTLAPGATWEGTFTSEITLADAANSNVDNTVSVTADATSGQTTVEVDGDFTAECAFNPVEGISISKTCPEIDPDARVGDEISYQVTITNTGDITLDITSVTDDRDGDFDSDFPATLAPAGEDGDSATRTFTSTITLADAASGNVNNTVTVNTNQGVGDTFITEDCVFNPVEGIEISKTCVEPEAGTRVGQSVTYNVTISNTGDVELTNIVVDDDRDGTWSPALPASLAPQGETGASWTGTFTSTITFVDAANGNIDNSISVTADATSGQTTVEIDDEATAECAFNPVEGVSISKTCPEIDPDARVGDEISYQVTITNTGDVELDGFLFSDNRAGSLAPNEGYAALADLVLAPQGEDGDTWVGTFTSAITLQDAANGNVDNTATISANALEVLVTDTFATEDCVFNPVEGISITKTCVEPETDARVGDPVSYEVTITNTGDVELTGVVVTDERAGTFDEPFPTTLAPAGEDGDSATRTFTSTITLADAASGNVNNTVSVGANATSGDTTTSVDDEVTATCAFMPVTGISIAKTCVEPAEGARVGDDVTYSVTISNTGDVTLTNIVVVDERTGTLAPNAGFDPIDASFTLAPGATWEGTFTSEITLADAANGNVDNTISASATAAYGSGDAAVSETVETGDVTAECAFMPVTGFSVSKTCPEQDLTGARIGSPLTYEITVLNTGDVALTNVVVTDARDATWSETIASIPVGESASVTFTSAITAGDAAAGNVDNTATVVADVVVGGVTTTLDSVSTTIECPFTPTTGIAIGKTCGEPGEGARVGGEVTYTITIENTGDVELVNIVITDNRDGTWNEPFPTSLARQGQEGDSATLTFTTTILPQDARDGNLDNGVSVTGDAVIGAPAQVESIPDIALFAQMSVGTVVVSDNIDIDCPFVPVTGIDVSKTCSELGEGARVGDELTYQVTITNTGDVAVEILSIVDEREGTFSPDPATLEPLAPVGSEGNSVTLTFTTTILASDAENNNVDNTVTVEGESTVGESTVAVDGEASVECGFTPLQNLEMGKTCPELEQGVRVGDEIAYEVTITNTGDVILYNVVVTDIRDGDWNEPFPTSLNAGQSETRVFTTIVTAADAENGNLDNTALFTADRQMGEMPSLLSITQVQVGEDGSMTAEVTAECPFEPVLGLALEKTASTPADEDVTAGTVITYTFAVTNTGDKALVNVVVVDQLEGLVWDEANADGAVGDLAAGETKTITATYVVTPADVEAGNVHNTAIATDGDIDSPPDDTDTPVTQNPAIDLVKTATLVNGEEVPYPIEHLLLGDLVTYELVATNTGDVTLTNVTITDPMEGLSALECDPAMPATLAPGETMTCLATYAMTQENLDGRNVDNTATVTGIAPDETEVTDTDTERVVGHFEPILEITKSASPDKDVKEGDTITYTFVVTNTGNITIHDIVVVDEMPGLVWDAANADGNVGTLAPGAEATLTATYVVVKADVEAGKVHNSAIASGMLDVCLDPDECEVTSPPAEVTVTVVQPKPPTVITPKPKPIAGLPNTGSGTSAIHGDLGWSVAMMIAVALAATAAGVRRRETA